MIILSYSHLVIKETLRFAWQQWEKSHFRRIIRKHQYLIGPSRRRFGTLFEHFVRPPPHMPSPQRAPVYYPLCGPSDHLGNLALRLATRGEVTLPHNAPISSYHNIIMTSYHHIIISEYSNIIIYSYHNVIIPRYHRIIISAYHKINRTSCHLIILS